jgi:hypothetical protein
MRKALGILIIFLIVAAPGCGDDDSGSGGAGGSGGSVGSADSSVGTDDASGTGGSGGTGVTGGTGGNGASSGTAGTGGTGGAEDAGSADDTGLSDAAVDAGVSKSDSGGIPSSTYTINDNGTVTDESTSLMWMQCAAGLSGDDCSEGSASTYTQQEAIDYCDSLDFAGHDDWWLPEIHELVSIVEYKKENPAIDATAFPATPSQSFWSSSSFAVNSSLAWYVYFIPGYVSYNGWSLASYARCVRGEPLVIGSFEPSVISGDPIVKDTATGLTWQGCLAGKSSASCDQGSAATFTWQEAVDYCESLTWAGYSDWRLPEIHELVSIVDYTKDNPAIDETAFPATSSDYFWSSSSLAGSSSSAWYVYFDYGSVNANNESSASYARCVRGGP